ncbi:uncharacterized protein LOC131237000 [Magnolia sinica]|uniref:uncharacterized protein LOC131237000 n=1 Tax=Magnolia sinica TaxID=86752 RepID=UPI00265AA53F|nr:uncharacterized protein LOC131237000 [Magnolia sinica]
MANMEVFDTYFRRADLDHDGRISGAEAVAFFQGSNLPKQILAQIWMHADQNRIGFLGRTEFYNALKLVTVAQSGRELTPDIVKAALYGPAAAKIPAPQISSTAVPATQLNPVASPSPQRSAVPPTASQNLGFRGPQGLPSAGMNQQNFPSPDNQFMRPPKATPALPMQGAAGQGFPGAGNVVGPHLANPNLPSSLPNDWFGARPAGTSMDAASQAPTRGVTPPSLTQDRFGLGSSSGPTAGVPNRGPTHSMVQDGFGLASGMTPSFQPRPQTPTMLTPAGLKPQDTVLSSLQPVVKDSKMLSVSGNGFSSDTVFGGDVFSASLSQPKQDVPALSFSATTTPNSSAIVPVTTTPQSTVKQAQVDPFQALAVTTSSSQLQQTSSVVKQNQVNSNQGTSALAAAGVSVGAAASASSESQHPWPRMTQSDIQKYTKVFVAVDTDKDGKITGEQARNLFLSWRLPREVLKQVWDLSDQDNDSMLSLREFCTALYLMERYREGRPLPTVLPNSLRFNATSLPTAGQQTTPAYGGAAWQPTPGLSQVGVPGTRSVMPAAGLRPPMQGPIPHMDGAAQLMPQKSRVPVLERNLVNQLGKEEQSAMDSNFHEANEADKKVDELKNEIMDSKEKLEFYRTKMQELVLYKSRCDNRLNEITERASADKREVETLAKKYEEKYKQVGEVASKLTIEEATFRDIQERKTELHNAIVKMEQGGSVDGLLQVRADRIQSDLEELGKGLNERCKRHGLHVKPTAMIELPFGWQPGIQEGATVWDEDWDKFEDEGFAVIKELTTEVENIVAPQRTKSTLVQSDEIFMEDDSGAASSSYDDSKTEKPSSTVERATENGSAYDQSEDDLARSPPGSPLGRISLEGSQEFTATHFGKNMGADASPSAKTHSEHGGAESTISDKYDETSWGVAFDANDDTDSVWGFNPVQPKELDHERNENSFFGSGDLGLNPIRTDSQNADGMFLKRSTIFADSVPGTPLFNTNSPPRYSEGSEDHSFDNFSRFDSFSMHDSGFFPPRENLARFDSIRSTRDSDHSQGFSSFDDADPFGSNGPFKTSQSQTQRRGSDSWSAF